MKINQHEIAFFRSAITKDSVISPTCDLLSWIIEQNKKINTSVNQIPLDKMRSWKFDPESGNIVHESGKFYSIEGIRVTTDYGNIFQWDQPIINQPEIGYLGILTKKINGVLHFLMQAKIEPGNINIVQISPTIQATKSNYTRVHKGKTPLFLEFFNGEKEVKILLDQLQSEQGARFLRKRNRNIIVEVNENEKIDVPNNFKWMTLGQLKELVKIDNVVNMDTRTVIAGITYGTYDSQTLDFFYTISDFRLINNELLNSALNGEMYYNSFDTILSWITKLKTRYSIDVNSIPLSNICKWLHNGTSIVHENNKYFEVIGVNVIIDNREVISWDQPMIKPLQEGIAAFIVKKIEGIYHFLVQAKIEPGNLDILELAPTVQCITGNYRTGLNEYSVPFINDVLNAENTQILYSALQSEEGGRFYKEQNLNKIIEATPDFPIEVPDNFCWMTLNQLFTFIKFNNYLNIEARSLISALSF